MQIQELNSLTKLFDAYGKLLSNKQYEVMDKFLNMDISASEMAELENGSRQAIHDAIKKAKKQLFDFEEKCGFVGLKQGLISELNEIMDQTNDDELKQKLENIITKL